MHQIRPWTCSTSTATGVELLQKPGKRPDGPEPVCRDNSGNWMVLVEPWRRLEYEPERAGINLRGE